MATRPRRTHVLGDVLAKDVVAQHLSVKLLALSIVPDKALGVVGDGQAAVKCTLRPPCPHAHTTFPVEEYKSVYIVH